MTACTTCAQNKLSKQSPSGLLQPLPKPGRLWSHISLDFITGLPPSAGNTTILTIIDWFSKAAHSVALPKLSTAIEMAQLLTTHVFSSVAFQRTLSQTEDPNLTLGYGGSSAPPWAQRSVYLLVVTPRADRVDQSRTGSCSIVVSQNQAA